MTTRFLKSEGNSVFHDPNSQGVVNAILERAKTLSSGRKTHDDRKLALIIEGGGMRSVCSAAGAVALAQLGFHELFDEIYATSAGVMNASYFITNQPTLGMSVYFENCTSWSFLNPYRFWKILNVDYIIDQVAAVEKPLNLEALKASASHFLVTACDQRTGEVVLIDTKATDTPLLTVLKAAMAIPVLYNRTVMVDGNPYIDSGTVLPFSLSHAIKRHCTDILVLQTRPKGFIERPPSAIQQRLFSYLHSFGNASLNRAFAERHQLSQNVRDIALGRIDPPHGVNIASICPEENACVEATTTNRRVTHQAAISYGRKTFEIFGEDPDKFDLRL